MWSRRVASVLLLLLLGAAAAAAAEELDDLSASRASEEDSAAADEAAATAADEAAAAAEDDDEAAAAAADDDAEAAAADEAAEDAAAADEAAAAAADDDAAGAGKLEGAGDAEARIDSAAAARDAAAAGKAAAQDALAAEASAAAGSETSVTEAAAATAKKDEAGPGESVAAAAEGREVASAGDEASAAAAAAAAKAGAAAAAAAGRMHGNDEDRLGMEGLMSPLVSLGMESRMAANTRAAAEQLRLVAQQAKEALEIFLQQQKTEDAKRRRNALHDKEALDHELGNYKTAVTLHAARLTHMRQRLLNEAAALRRLGDLFVAKANLALNIINNQYRPFELKLHALEETIEGLLAQGTGRVSLMLRDYRKQLQDAAAAEVGLVNDRVHSLVTQMKSWNLQLDELAQLSEEARVAAAREVVKVEGKMADTLRLFDLLTRQELLQLAQQQQHCALKEIESFQEKLSGMHLHEHVLETLVDRFTQDLEDYKERRRVSRLLTYMDLSTAFAGPRPQSVCSVLTHLVRQKEAARDVAVVFVYGIDPPKESGLDPNSPMAVPTPKVLKAAAASWKARTEVYGHRATSYAIVRVEGLLLEVFTVPFLESERIGFSSNDELRAASPSDFSSKLADAVHEANLTGGGEAPFSLIVYLGQLKDDRIRPPPTRDLSHNRTMYVRHMVEHIEPSSKALIPVWDRLQAQLRFIDAAAAALKEGSSSGEAVQLAVRRLDVEIVCFAAPIEPPPCRRDPHLREALHYLQVRLTPLSGGGFILPDDSILTAALTSLVRLVHLGGPSCPIVVSTKEEKRKRFWQRRSYYASVDIRTTDLPRRGSKQDVVGGGGGLAGLASPGIGIVGGGTSLGLSMGAPHEEDGGGGAPGASGSIRSKAVGEVGGSADGLYLFGGGPVTPERLVPGERVRGGGPRTAREVKGISLADAVALLAKAAEGVVLLSEPWTRGYTLYVHVCISGSTC